MRVFLLLAAACAAAAQPAAFTLDQVLGAPFPSSLTAAPSGGKLAWVSNARGVRNILVAEPPRYEPRKITAYTADDGQDLSDLQWTPDSSSIVYVRGQGGEAPNPGLDPRGAEQALWIVGLGGAPPRRIGDGALPAISPKGDRLAFVRRGKLWLSALDGSDQSPAFQGRGTSGRPVWSPDGARIAFTNARGDHSFIGVWDTGAATLRYLDPATSFDANPEWSPDGRSIAFTRVPGTGLRAVREARRAGEPWSIRVAAADTGIGREVWRSSEGPGSVLREVNAASQLLWMDGNRLVFPWEADGWTHLYSVPAAGGKALLLTPGEFEVEDVIPARGRREVIFSSNQGDIDRRHIWRVNVAGGAATAITSGTGIESQPVAATDEVVAFLRSTDRDPLRPAIASGGTTRGIGALPADFPLAYMTVPQAVTFPAADGLQIHGQLFLPPNRSGRAPAVVFFHGGPLRQMLLGWHYGLYYHNAYAFNQFLAASGYVVLSVNFRSGTGYGMNFREAPQFGASGASDFNDVQGAAQYLRSRADVDPTRIGAWGGSYGGFLTALALARAGDIYRAGVDLHGVHNWATELSIPPTEPDYKTAFDASPMNYVSGWRSPVLLIAGDDDRNVQFNQTVMLASALRRQKVQVEELIFPDEVHAFLLYRSWLNAFQAAAAFLDRKLLHR